MQKVLITGGAGYIGSHMAKMAAQQGYDVHIADDLSRGVRANMRGSAQQVDLKNKQAISNLVARLQPDTVMHFAAYAYVGESVQYPSLYYENNLVGLINLLVAMENNGVENLVFSSSCTVYGHPKSLPITEEADVNPISPYGRSKAMAEQIIEDAAKSGVIRSVALRYFNAAGSDIEGELGEIHDTEPHLVPNVLLEALRVKSGGDPADSELVVNGNDFDTEDGSCVRDYVHVQDLCDAHIRALEYLEANSGFTAINLGTGSGYSVLEIIQACRRVTGEDIQFSIGPRREGDPAELVASAEKAFKLLNWRPANSSLDKIVSSAWKWFLANYSQSSTINRV